LDLLQELRAVLAELFVAAESNITIFLFPERLDEWGSFFYIVTQEEFRIKILLVEFS
jgi:hypothetical protein